MFQILVLDLTLGFCWNGMVPELTHGMRLYPITTVCTKAGNMVEWYDAIYMIPFQQQCLKPLVTGHMASRLKH